MADVAALSVVSSALVGVLGAVAGFYGQRMVLRGEEARRREARRDDLRQVVDDAARAALGVTRPPGFNAATVGELVTWFARIEDAMSAPEAGLGVRVGPNADVYVAYNALRTRLEDAERAYRGLPAEMTFGELMSSDTPEATSAQEITRSFDDAVRAFLRAAAKAVGSDT